METETKKINWLNVVPVIIILGFALFSSYETETYKDYLEQRIGSLEREVSEYRREGYLESYNENITKLMYENVDSLKFYFRKSIEIPENVALFKSTYELYPKSAEKFYNDYSGFIEFYSESVVDWNDGFKRMNYTFLDKYAKDFKVESLDENQYSDYFTGTIKTNVDFSLNEENIIQEINSVTSTVKFDSVYGMLNGNFSMFGGTNKAKDILIDYELLTELPANKVDIKIIQTIDPILFSEDAIGEIEIKHKEKVLEQTITIINPY